MGSTNGEPKFMPLMMILCLRGGTENVSYKKQRMEIVG